MPVQLRRLPATVTALLLAAALLPCNAADDKKQAAPVATIKGTVRFEGKPLPAGIVGFHPAKGKPVVGPVQADGTYVIKEIAPGTYRVTIATEPAKQAPKEKNPATDKAEPKDKDAAKGDPAKDGARYVPIPRVYGDPKTTPLTVMVQAGKNVHDFQLRR